MMISGPRNLHYDSADILGPETFNMRRSTGSTLGSMATMTILPYQYPHEKITLAKSKKDPVVVVAYIPDTGEQLTLIENLFLSNLLISVGCILLAYFP